MILASIEEAVIPKTNSFETEALVKPEDNMAVYLRYVVWNYETRKMDWGSFKKT